MGNNKPSRTLVIDYFSDVLCIWAYGAQIRIDQLKEEFGERIELRYRFIPLFGATSIKNHFIPGAPNSHVPRHLTANHESKLRMPYVNQPSHPTASLPFYAR